MELDYSSLVAVRLTCKQFYNATKTIQFWLNHVQRLKEHSGYVLDFEESFYTEGELEEWVSRRYRMLEGIWSKSSPPRLQVRSLDLPVEIMRGFYDYEFLPGGRWLLCFGKDRALLMDTGGSISDPSCLTSLPYSHSNVQSQTSSYEQIEFACVVDHTKPRLSFLFAKTSQSNEVFTTSISQALLASEHSSNSTFTPRLHATFTHDVVPREDIDYSWVTALSSRYFAKIERLCSDSRMTVFDYSTTVGAENHPNLKGSCISLTNFRYCWALKFIHRSTLVAAYSSRVHVLEVIETETAGKPAIIQQLHVIEMDYAIYEYMSPVRWYQEYSQVTVYDDNNLPSLLTIPHDKSAPSFYRPFKIGDDYFPGGKSMQFGYSWAIRLSHPSGSDPPPVIEFVKYPWGSTGSEFVPWNIRVGVPNIDPIGMILAFSEEVGRLVTHWSRNDVRTIRVIDLV
ncbi:hypothetical protein D9756_000108 [Leucocoprinus leucothites]|uniref:F-box domain-containing protein n=1 Tax=Leucocoprinus leucothites TaxID=201217 RepID=A0A8H5GFX3_9AGAR|nr:hypothetical protein D9756_000108 [Leucoagaricus leucothites]